MNREPRTANRAVLGVLGVLAVAIGCGRGSAAGDASGAPKPPIVRADGGGLAFFWFAEDGSIERAESAGDVPEPARARVLVQPIGPGQAGSGAWAFVADLRAPGPDGIYPVRVVTREAYSEEIRSRHAASQTAIDAATAAEDAGSAGPAVAPATTDGKVVMYMTQGCPHCRRAREWFARNRIPLVERDVERDPQALRFIQERTGSTAVPVFQVGSRIVQGFSTDALRRVIKEQIGIDLL